MDFSVEAPWGKIACVSWGSRRNPGVLLVHGYMDSAATFIPLVRLLPRDYYYVAIDMPGHGRSDPFPVGPVVSHAHQLEAARRVVEHLGWTSFIFVSHSVGFIIGVLYNVVYPGRVTRMVHLDPVPPLTAYCYHHYQPTHRGVLYNVVYPGRVTRMVHLDPVPPLTAYCYHHYQPTVWFAFTHEEYYEKRWDLQRNKTICYEDAVNSVMQKRKVNREQAEVLLSRGLIDAGEAMYRFSWEPSMKKVAALPLSEEQFHSLMKMCPPTLNIVAQDSVEVKNVRGVELIKKFADTIFNFHIFNVVGTHDVHVTNPERFSDVMCTIHIVHQAVLGFLRSQRLGRARVIN